MTQYAKTYDKHIMVLSSTIHYHKSSSYASIARGSEGNPLAFYKEDIILGSAWISTKGLDAIPEFPLCHELQLYACDEMT